MHVFTFDCIEPFPKPVPFASLKQMGCVNDANLVAPQKVNQSDLQKILAFAFGEDVQWKML